MEELGIDGTHLRLDHVGLIDMPLHREVRQVGEETGIGITYYGDHAHSTILDEGHGERIITRKDDEVLGELACGDLSSLLRVARRLLDPDDIIEVPRQAHDSVGSHIHPDTPRHVVEHQRKRARLGQVGEVTVHPLL